MNINKIIKNEKLILFFILLLVIYLLNLDINTEKKLSLMIVGLLVCIYDTKMIIPYITGLLILLSLHFQKKKDNNIKNKKTIETFQQSSGERDIFQEKMLSFTDSFSGDNFNPRNYLTFVIKNINLYKLYLRLNSIEEKPNIDFLRDLYFIPFFIINANLDGIKLKNLVNNQGTIDTLVNRLQFSNTNDRNPQKEYINELENLFQSNQEVLDYTALNLKIGLLFTKFRDSKYSRYLNKVGLSLGFLGFINDNLIPILPNTDNISFEEEYLYIWGQLGTDVDREYLTKIEKGRIIRERFRNSEFEFRIQKKNIQEIIILLHKIKNNFTDDYDINKSIDSEDDTNERFSDLKNINEYDVNLFEIFNLNYINSENHILKNRLKILLNYNYKNSNPTFLLRGTGDDIYLKLTIDDLLTWDDNFTSTNMFGDIGSEQLRRIKNEMVSSPAQSFSEINTEEEIENLVKDIIDKYEDKIEEIGIFKSRIFRGMDQSSRGKEILKIKNNISIILLFHDTLLINFINNLDENYKELFYSVLDDKLDSIKGSRNREEIMDDKFVFISFEDLFYNNIIFYLNQKHENNMFSPGISGNTEDNDSNYLQHEEYYTTFEEPEIIETPTGPSPSSSLTEFSENQIISSMNELEDLYENQLDYKFKKNFDQYLELIDKNDYIPALDKISKISRDRLEDKKIEKLSFSNTVENFSTNLYEIIDELTIEFRNFYHYITNNKAPHPSYSIYEEFQNSSESNDSPTPSISDSDNTLEYYINFLIRIFDILTKRDRVLHSGVILLGIAIFIYFIDNNSPNRNYSNNIDINTLQKLLKANLS